MRLGRGSFMESGVLYSMTWVGMSDICTLRMAIGSVRHNRGRKGKLLPALRTVHAVLPSTASGRWFPHRDWRARTCAPYIVKSPRSAKKAFCHCL